MLVINRKSDDTGITVESLNVTENGTYTAPSGKAYSPVKVEIPDPPTPSIFGEVKGNPITFTDGADAPLVECKAEIVATQDLHGYDKPWVGGAGKNKFDIKGWLDSVSTTYTQNGDSFTITSQTTLYSTPFVFSDTDVQVTFSFDSFTNDTTTYARLTLLDSNNNIVDTRYAGDVAPLTVIASKCRFDWTNGGNFTINKPQIELGNQKSAFAPYSNICPISGFSEVEIENNGTVNIIAGVIPECNIGPTGTLQNNSEFDMYYARVKKGSTYSSNYTITGGFFTSKPQMGSVSYDSNRVVNMASPFIAPITGYVAFRTSVGVTNAMLVEGSTVPSQYVAPNNHLYTISLGSTRYGGELDVSRGVLTLTKKEVVFDGSSDESWAYNSSNQGFYIINALDSPKIDNASADFAICNMAEQIRYNAVSGSSFVNGMFAIGNSGTSNVFYLKNTAYSSESDFKTWLASNNLQVVYELATPLTISLTPTQVRSLLGNNYLSCNSGELDVLYIKEGYQEFVDLIESTFGTRKAGPTPMDVFRMLEEPKDSETEVEEPKKEDETLKK